MGYELINVENNKIVLSEDIIKELCKFQRIKLKMDLMQEKLKEEFLKAMSENGIEKYISHDGSIVVNYVAPTKRKSLDQKTFKEEMPEIYQKYIKESDVSGCVKITVK